MNPVHGAFVNPHLWECEGIVGLENADKVGCTSLTTLQRMCKPLVTLTQRRKFAILCALEVYELWSKYDTDKAWYNWAEGWLNGKRAARAAWDARAAWAAGDAGAAGETIDLVVLAHKAMEKEV